MERDRPQELHFSYRHLQISSEHIWVLTILFLPLNFPQNGGFPAPNFVFLKKTFFDNNFSDKPQFTAVVDLLPLPRSH